MYAHQHGNKFSLSVKVTQKLLESLPTDSESRAEILCNNLFRISASLDLRGLAATLWNCPRAQDVLLECRFSQMLSSFIVTP